MNFKYIIYIFVLGLAFWGCNTSRETNTASDKAENTRNKEAREDSIKLAQAFQAQSEVQFEVFADHETDPVAAHEGEDAADDPAFWYNSINPDSSLVFGTHKKGGIYAYTLSGSEYSFNEVGMVNNIDIRQSVVLGDTTIDLLGGSNRSDNSLVLYTIDQNGQIKPLMDNFVIDTTEMDEVYGFCLYKDSNQNAHAIINSKNGVIRQYALSMEDNLPVLNLAAEWSTNSQPEGMVADDQSAILFIGEEEKGIWKLDINSPQNQPEILTESQKENNAMIEYDIEGLAIYKGKAKHYLIASIQGSFSYAVFDLEAPHHYHGSFKITDGKVDGVEETDGLEIYGGELPAPFNKGLLMVQDGFNEKAGKPESQNFKLIDLQKVLELEIFKEEAIQ